MYDSICGPCYRLVDKKIEEFLLFLNPFNIEKTDLSCFLYTFPKSSRESKYHIIKIFLKKLLVHVDIYIYIYMYLNLFYY